MTDRNERNNGQQKIALVTGASGGIGAAVAVRLAGDGYDVAVHFHRQKEKAEEVLHAVQRAGSRGMILQADLANREQVEDMFLAMRKELGEASLVVCNAGMAGQAQIQDVKEETWKRLFAVNVDGAFHTVQCALPPMLHAHEGCIVLVSSIWGIRGASCESVYAATKAALIGFGRSLARELAPSGIRVNCLAPGVIDTTMLDELSEDTKKQLAEETPLGRLGTPGEIAAAVSFLASDEASFLTGQVLTCDGGFTV